MPIQDEDLQASFRPLLVERLRQAPAIVRRAKPSSHTFKTWLSYTLTADELSRLAEWEARVGDEHALEFLRSCQQEAGSLPS